MKEYVTLTNTETVYESVIEKSRFIASAIGVESVEQAVSYIESKRKQYYDATHNCYAYIVGDKAKYSDDGEPQGTAGLPMYDCVKNNKLDKVCVVVTRYFGGIKLGAGGLVRAYSGGVSEVLKRAERVQMTDCTVMNVTVDYNLLSVVRRALQGTCKETNVVFADKVTLELLFPTLSLTTITHIVTQNTLGKAQIDVVENKLCNYKG